MKYEQKDFLAKWLTYFSLGCVISLFSLAFIANHNGGKFTMIFIPIFVIVCFFSFIGMIATNFGFGSYHVEYTGLGTAFEVTDQIPAPRFGALMAGMIISIITTMYVVNFVL